MVMGYTTGVFDLFHISHLNAQKDCRKLVSFYDLNVADNLVCKELGGGGNRRLLTVSNNYLSAKFGKEIKV